MNAKVRLLVVVFSKICILASNYFRVCGLSRSVIVFQLFDWQICIYGKITLLFLFLDYRGLFGPLYLLWSYSVHFGF